MLLTPIATDALFNISRSSKTLAAILEFVLNDLLRTSSLWIILDSGITSPSEVKPQATSYLPVINLPEHARIATAVLHRVRGC